MSIKNSGDPHCLQGRRQADFIQHILNICHYQSQWIHQVFLPTLLLCYFSIIEKHLHHLKHTGFIASMHRHNLTSSFITGRIKMAFLVFTGTYMRTIMWPTVWRTALSQLYLCLWAGCWNNNPFPRKESDIPFYIWSNHTLLLIFLDDCYLFFLFLFIAFTYHPCFPCCVGWWCFSCLFPHILPSLVPHAWHSRALWHV